jgi:hypothetical protein
MSALGQKRTLVLVKVMSALPPKADIRQCDYDVRFVPKDGVIGRRLVDRRGKMCPRMAQATSRLRGGSLKGDSGENLEPSTKRQGSCRLNCLPLSGN